MEFLQEYENVIFDIKVFIITASESIYWEEYGNIKYILCFRLGDEMHRF